MINNTSFLFQEIITELVNHKISLVSPLLKLHYFGKLVKNKELVQFTLNEIKGYDNPMDIPDYRKMNASIIVEILINDNRKSLSISPFTIDIDEKYHEILRYIRLKEGIETLEKMSHDSENLKDDNPKLTFDLPMDVLSLIEPSISRQYHNKAQLLPFTPYLFAEPYKLNEVINFVRVKLMAFAMEVAEKFSHKIEISSFIKNQIINNQTINNIMNTEIKNTGDGNVVNTGDSANIYANINVTKENINVLRRNLENQGVETQDIDEISEIVKTEQPDYAKKELGEKSKNWIQKVVGTSADGTGKIAIGIASNILATILKGYFGILG